MDIVVYIGGSANVWKENILEDLEKGNLGYKTVEKFLVDLKKEFRERNNEIIKVAELKRIKQGNRMTEEFIYEFRRVARDNKYKERLLVEKLK